MPKLLAAHMLIWLAATSADAAIKEHAPAGSQHGTALPAEGCSDTIALDVSQPRPAFDLILSNGTTVQAVLDTGATSSSINIDVADQLGFKNEGPLRPPFDEHSTGYQSSLAGARIGSLAIPDHSVAVMPSPLPDKAVILSPNAFRGQLVQIDMKAGALKLCDKNWAGRPAGEGFPYAAPPFALPAVPVSIGGQTIEAHIDTGSPFTLSLPPAYAQQVKLAEPLKKAGEARMHAGPPIPILAAKVEERVMVGPLALESPRIFFTDLSSGANVGTGLLRQMVITLDPEANRSWLEFASKGERG